MKSKQYGCMILIAAIASSLPVGCSSPPTPTVSPLPTPPPRPSPTPTPEPKRLVPYGLDDARDPYAYDDYLYIDDGSCADGVRSRNDLPEDFDCEDFEYTDYADNGDRDLRSNPQEFFGVRGPGINRAWEISTGRPDTIIGITDCGVRWHQPLPGLVRKFYLNRAELPLPNGEANSDDLRFDGYDANLDGVFNVDDYADDPRVADLNGNGMIDPEDLIRTFSDGIDGDNNGYTDDISGWDFFENDNNPQDDTEYDHGTLEARWSGGEAGAGNGLCPNCMVMPLRVGDSFVADVNHFAEAAVYATDNGADVIQEALGTLNHTSYGQSAVEYAYRNGVMVAASAADEAAAHRMWPAAYEHTTVFNAIQPPKTPLVGTISYVFLSGCTNFGGNIFSSVPATDCSSEAVARAAGMVGLLVSAADNAVDRGSMTRYLRDDGTYARYALSVSEQQQLWRLACDDIDFSTPYPDHSFSAAAPALLPSNRSVVSTPNNYTDIEYLLVETERYHTVKGWDYFTGYGRINAARLLRFIGLEGVTGYTDREYLRTEFEGPLGVGADTVLSAQDRIPPEADITWPRWWEPVAVNSNGAAMLPTAPTGVDDADHSMLVIHGRATANRVTSTGGRFEYRLEYAPNPQGPGYGGANDDGGSIREDNPQSGGPWFPIASADDLSGPLEGELGRISVAELLAAAMNSENVFAPEDDPTSRYAPERYAIRLRLTVRSHPANTADNVNNVAVFQKQIYVYPMEESVLIEASGANNERTGMSGSPTIHDLNGDGVDELIVTTDDGVIHAFTDVAARTELDGWPVTTRKLDGVQRPGENAYARGDVSTNAFGAVLVGAPAVADLDDDGVLEVIAADMEGYIYAWQVDGQLRAGFPVSINFALSKQRPCGPDTIPDCDDYEPGPKLRDPTNNRDWAITSAPSVGDLDPTYVGLEILAGCADSHIYAWHADGTPVPGWPVVLRDPSTLASMDDETRVFEYSSAVNAGLGSKTIVTPSLADIDGDGDLEVISGTNEAYVEQMNLAWDADPLLGVVNVLEQGGNTRLYVLHHTGADTPPSAGTPSTVHPQAQAYYPGWPTPIALIAPNLLPYVAAGTNTNLALCDINRDGLPEIVGASSASPVYVLRTNGRSFYGTDRGLFNSAALTVANFGRDSCAEDGPSAVALSGAVTGSLDGGATLAAAAGAAGLTRLADLGVVARQVAAEDHLGIWSLDDGDYLPNAPIVINDLQFFATPIIADITGDGRAEVIQGTAVNDLVSVGREDTCETATRRFTGGFTIGSATVGGGPFADHTDNHLGLVSTVREGFIRVYPTGVPADDADAVHAALGEWPEYGHDAQNTSAYAHDAQRPYPVADLTARVVSDRLVQLDFVATGDDRDYGRASRYAVRRLPAAAFDAPAADAPLVWLAGELLDTGNTRPSPAGVADSVIVGPLEPGEHHLMIRAYDEADNGSAFRSVRVTVP